MDKFTTIYFAHPVTHYNSYIEDECIQIILNMILPIDRKDGDYLKFELVNPNQQWTSNLYLNRKKNGDGNEFEFFREMVRACDIIIGTTYLDGSIGAGVAEEMEEGLRNGKDVYLILFDNGRKLFLPYLGSSVYNVLSIEDTKKRTQKGTF